METMNIQWVEVHDRKYVDIRDMQLLLRSCTPEDGASVKQTLVRIADGLAEAETTMK